MYIEKGLRAFAGVLLVLLAAVAAEEAVAQTAPQTRYPWDKRPEFCFQRDTPDVPQCASDDWPTWHATLERVTYLYEFEQFVLLERALKELVASKKVFVNGDSPASAAYWAFRILMRGPGVDPSHQGTIARWKAAIPGSDFAAFAEARFLYANAWNVRGSGFAGSVSRESWELFDIRLQEAESVLRNSSETLKNTPLWHNLMLAIAQDGTRGRSRADAVFEEAVRRWPRYFEFYEVRLTRLVPKWGGSWAEVESFIDRWSRKLAPSEGASAYARLYVSVKNQGVTPDQTAMDWARMKASFEDLTKRYPDPAFKNLYASYACFARDKAAFNIALAKLSAGELDEGVWLPGHSYEACLRWAGI